MSATVTDRLIATIVNAPEAVENSSGRQPSARMYAASVKATLTHKAAVDEDDINLCNTNDLILLFGAVITYGNPMSCPWMTPADTTMVRAIAVRIKAAELAEQNNPTVRRNETGRLFDALANY